LRKKVWKNFNEIEKLPGARCRNQNRKFLHRKWRPERGSEGTERKHSSLSEAVKREAIALENRHTPPSTYFSHRLHCFSLILLLSDLSSDFIVSAYWLFGSVSGTVIRFVFPRLFLSATVASVLGVGAVVMPWRV
jgi:hypothetical protein